MNILPGQGDSAGRITALGVAVEEALAEPSEGPLSVGFRPEHLHIQPKDAGACFSGRLTYKENLGSDVFLHLAVEGIEGKAVIRAKPHEADFADVGEDVWFTGEVGKARVFGADGKRVTLAEPQLMRMTS
ncbi:MAG: TOBE domain-containing protein [Boseongicola sp.]|nr:TOBE domain-containing protein [Boseongicola sp.]